MLTILFVRTLAIVFLCSKEAKWITGLIMPVDGGVSPRLFNPVQKPKE